jgi:hypothetical protein
MHNPLRRGDVYIRQSVILRRQIILYPFSED